MSKREHKLIASQPCKGFKPLQGYCFIAFFQLLKPKITASVVLTTFAGFIIYNPEISSDFWFAIIGTFLLAGASASINQVQESNIDQIMFRTQNRPIPSGRISKNKALIFGLLLAITGGAILFLFNNLTTFLLGLSALFWYNLIYTPLKRKTAFAVFPGSVIGAIPPLIGWTAAGGSLTEPKILAFSMVLFIWQIPHFWLLLIKYADDYTKAGLPNLKRIFTKKQIIRITYVWSLATFLSGLLLPLFQMPETSGLVYCIIAFSVILAIQFIYYSFIKQNDKAMFIMINIYMLIIVSLICIDKFVAG